MRRLFHRIYAMFRPSLGFRSLGRWVLFGGVTGILSGLGAAAFYVLLDLTGYLVFDLAAGVPRTHPAGEGLFHPEGPFDPHMVLFMLLPAIGGLFSGVFVQRFAPEAAGVGTEALIDAFHRHRGNIRTKVPFVKAIGTLFTLGFGGASGREGPIAQIGGGLGSWLARRFGLSARDRRILLLAGAAGGFGAIFRAPLGGAVTAVEVPYREDLETDALVPCVISSVTAYAIFAGLFGFHTIFALPHDLEFTRPHEFVFYLVLGLLCAPIGAITVQAFWWIHGVFSRIKFLPLWALPALGGLLVGLVGLLSPGVYGSGWGVVQQALEGNVLLSVMGILLVAKILAMGLTLGSGGSGGVFGPTLFIGAMLGGLFGTAAIRIFPGLAPDPAAMIIVGMCAFFAGVANAPLGALLMTIEISRSYGLVAPLMLVSVIAVLFTSRWSIFRCQVRNKFHSPAHQGDLNTNVLKRLTVAAAMAPADPGAAILSNARVPEIRGLLSRSKGVCFPVVHHRDQRLVGILSEEELRSVLFEKDLDALLVAADVAGPPISFVSSEDLHHALLTLLDSGYDEVPVTDDESGRILGTLSHSDLLRAYHREIARLAEEADEENR